MDDENCEKPLLKVKLDIPVDEDAIMQEKDILHEEEAPSSQSLSDEESKDTAIKSGFGVIGQNRNFNIYDEGIIFVDPLFILDPRNHSCLCLKLQLTRMVKQVPD